MTAGTGSSIYTPFFGVSTGAIQGAMPPGVDSQGMWRELKQSVKRAAQHLYGPLERVVLASDLDLTFLSLSLPSYSMSDAGFYTKGRTVDVIEGPARLGLQPRIFLPDVHTLSMELALARVPERAEIETFLAALCEAAPKSPSGEPFSFMNPTKLEPLDLPVPQELKREVARARLTALVGDSDFAARCGGVLDRLLGHAEQRLAELGAAPDSADPTFVSSGSYYEPYGLDSDSAEYREAVTNGPQWPTTIVIRPQTCAWYELIAKLPAAPDPAALRALIEAVDQELVAELG